MKTFFKNILHERIFFFIFYLKPIATSHKHSSAHSCFIPSFTYVYGWLLLCIGNIVFYSFPECILFLYSLDPRSPASAYCFLFLSVNQAARGARDDTLFLYSRSAPFRGTERPADSRTKNHNRRSRGEIHGGLLTSREGDLRVSMQIPVVAPWRGGGGGGGGKKVGAADTNKMRRGRSKRRRRY